MNIKSIEDLYSFVEENSDIPSTPIGFTRRFQQLADSYEDEETKEIVKWEIFVFDFHLYDGKALPVHSSPKNDSTRFEYPSFKDFAEKAYDYLRERAKNVKSDFLKARYNQVLWNAPKEHKHQQQAKLAIEAYLRILQTLNCIEEEKRDGRDCLDLLKNGFALALQVRYKIDDFKILFTSWLFDRGKFNPDMRIHLLNYLIEIPQLRKNDFDGCLELVRKIGVAKTRQGRVGLFWGKEIMETGLNLAQRIGSDTKVWNKRVGDALVRMAEYRMDDQTKMIPLSFYEEAIPYYKAAGARKKVKYAEQKYFELKSELRLAKIEVPMPKEHSEMLFNYFKAKTEKLLEHESEAIFGYLLTGEDIFPKKLWLVEMSKNNKNSFLDVITSKKFDLNNNISKGHKTLNEKERAGIYEQYHYYLNIIINPLLHRLFVEGIKCGKVTYENLVLFFLKNTWLGQELSDYDLDGSLVKFRWIDLLSPSLHEYFIQTEAALRSNNAHTNYVMPIDSLVLKFEGVLRDFARINGVSTTISGKGDGLREKYIEELLAEKEIKRLFDENDLLLFNFLFIGREGMNLRNNIAHCFYRRNNYSFHLMHLLICAFLRVGKYRIQTNTDKNS